MNTNNIKSLSAPNEIFIKTKTEKEEFINFNSKIKNFKIGEHQSRRLKSRQKYTKQHLFNSNDYVASTSNNLIHNHLDNNINSSFTTKIFNFNSPSPSTSQSSPSPSSTSSTQPQTSFLNKLFFQKYLSPKLTPKFNSKLYPTIQQKYLASKRIKGKTKNNFLNLIIQTLPFFFLLILTFVMLKQNSQMEILQKRITKIELRFEVKIKKRCQINK